jgi:hypothetical protein
MSCCSGIDPAIAAVLQAREAALRSEVSTAIVAQQLDAVEQQGAALNQFLADAAQLGKSLSSGRTFDALA